MNRKSITQTSFIKSIYKRILRDDVSGMAAQLAYFFLLSLFPLMIFLVSLLPYLPIKQEDILGFAAIYAPAETMDMIEKNLNDVMKGNGKLLSLGIIGTIWTASAGMNSIISAFNRAYEVKESRHFIVSRLLSILFTIGMIAVFLTALLLPVFGKQIGILLTEHLGLSEEFISSWNVIRWVISSIVLFIIFLAIYWFAPNIKLKCLSIVPGALFAAAGWIVSSYAFSFYVEKSTHYSSAYGSLGGIIVLMVWFYITGIILIIGGEINAIVSSRKKPDC
ncbi:YihY/virulence factor BrkB family protein [Peribacillus deserti]|uniref:Ribonuclease n=1 Tax=Peribacillus deserti TaxID=673318 RepID=A0A2N5MC29_9BACI|nr:YihY/virulence factor BrkB family protein [Peribacillus deserti]PLT31910.1 ribonuclease [Peribacillus deserti]